MREVLVVDDHPIVLDAMSEAARSLFPEAAVHTAATLAGAIKAARAAERIDLALLDLGLPDASGLPVLTAFREACPGTPVVVFSATEDRTIVLGALQAGARGFVPKSSTPDVIAAALRLIAAGGTYVPVQALGAEAGGEAQEPPAGLTGRQLDVLRLMAQGLANKQIARQLRIAHDTVKNHARALYAALGVQTRKDAARVAARRGVKLD